MYTEINIPNMCTIRLIEFTVALQNSKPVSCKMHAFLQNAIILHCCTAVLSEPVSKLYIYKNSVVQMYIFPIVGLRILLFVFFFVVVVFFCCCCVVLFCFVLFGVFCCCFFCFCCCCFVFFLLFFFWFCYFFVCKIQKLKNLTNSL